MTRGGEDCPLFVPDDVQPVVDIGRVVLARFRRQCEVGGREGCAKLGDKLLHPVALSPNRLRPKLRSSRDGACVPTHTQGSRSGFPRACGSRRTAAARCRRQRGNGLIAATADGPARCGKKPFRPFHALRGSKLRRGRGTEAFRQKKPSVCSTLKAVLPFRGEYRAQIPRPRLSRQRMLVSGVSSSFCSLRMAPQIESNRLTRRFSDKMSDAKRLSQITRSSLNYLNRAFRSFTAKWLPTPALSGRTAVQRPLSRSAPLEVTLPTAGHLQAWGRA
jgi:hypothetical protein